MEDNEVMVQARTLDAVTAEIVTIKRQTERMMLQNSIEIGRRLCEAKDLVGHGGWGAYLRERVEFSQSTANNLMRLYEEYGELPLLGGGAKSQAIVNLTYTQALALLAAPEDDREALAQKAAEEDVSVAELKAMIAKQAEDADKSKSQAEGLMKQLEAAKVEAQKAMEKAKSEAAKSAEKVRAAAEKARKAAEKEIAEARERIKAAEEARKNTITPDDVEQAKKAARAETEAEIKEQRQHIEKLEKQLAIQGNPHAAEVKRKFADMQQLLAAMEEELEKLEETDPEEEKKVRAGVARGVRMMAERLEK